MKSYFDIQGDGGSKILDQVLEQRRRVEEALSGVRTLLAIGSGKGGVGKSTVAYSLAMVLQGRQQRCALLDADLNGPSQARLAGLREAPLLPSSQGSELPRTASGLRVLSLGSAIPEAQTLDFDSVAEGDTFTWRSIREFTLLSDLLASTHWGELDYLVIDLPPGAERTRQAAEFFGPRAAFVLVTLPSALSKGVVHRSLKALLDTESPVIGYVENMKGYYCDGCDSLKPLFSEEGSSELPLECLGAIPFDPALAAACDRGAWQPNGGPVARALDGVADRVEGWANGRQHALKGNLS